MARPKKLDATASESPVVTGRKVSVREVLELQKEMRGEPGEPPLAFDEKKQKLLPMKPEIHATRRADFTGADLSGQDFQSMDLRSVVFRGCDLSNTDFTNANLQGCDFKDANIEGAIFDGADLRWAINPTGNPFPSESSE